MFITHFFGKFMHQNLLFRVLNISFLHLRFPAAEINPVKVNSMRRSILLESLISLEVLLPDHVIHFQQVLAHFSEFVIVNILVGVEALVYQNSSTPLFLLDYGSSLHHIFITCVFFRAIFPQIFTFIYILNFFPTRAFPKIQRFLFLKMEPNYCLEVSFLLF